MTKSKKIEELENETRDLHQKYHSLEMKISKLEKIVGTNRNFCYKKSFGFSNGPTVCNPSGCFINEEIKNIPLTDVVLAICKYFKIKVKHISEVGPYIEIIKENQEEKIDEQGE